MTSRPKHHAGADDARVDALSIDAPPGLAASCFAVEGEEFALLEWTPFATAASPAGSLTAAESAVSLLAATGRTNASIARDRGVSQRTIANQLASVYRKLGVGSRAELCARFAMMGSRPGARR